MPQIVVTQEEDQIVSIMDIDIDIGTRHVVYR
jgi:hypothetical protein